MEYIDKDIQKQIYIRSIMSKMESLAKVRNYYAAVGFHNQENNKEIEDMLDSVGAIVCVLEKMTTRPPELK